MPHLLLVRYKIIIKNKKLPPAGGLATVNGPNDDSDFEEEHFINDLSSEDEEEDEEDIVLPLELYMNRRQQRIRDDFSISSSPLPARHNVRTRWVGVIVPIHLSNTFKLSAQE